MSASYEVVLIHKEMEEFAEEVTRAVRTAANEVLAQPDLLDFKYEMSTASPDSHVAVVYLGNVAGGDDSAVTGALKDAVSRQFPVA